MQIYGLRWGAIVGLAVLAEVLLIASAVLYVVIYSYAINPHQPNSVYEAHARVASPWVSIAVGLPLLYLFSPWIARRSPAGLANGLAIWACLFVVDNAILIGAAGFKGITDILPFWLASHATKLLGAWAGGRGAG
jgi:hypothetical protein